MAEKQISLIGLYNAIRSREGLNFPRHLMAPAAGIEDKRIDKLLVILGPSSGKSSFIDTIVPVYLLGKDPSLSILLISAGESLVNSFSRAAVEIIEHSPIYRAAFPGVKPNKALGWSENRGYFIQRPNAGDAKASLISVGIDSSHLTGLHAGFIVLDDLHNAESSASKTTCDKVIETYYNTLVHRDIPQGSRFIGVGRRWSEHDIYGHLMNSGDWVTLVLPAERGEGVRNLWWDVLVPEGIECVFTEGFAEPQEPTDEQRAKGLRPYRAYYGTDPEEKGFYWPDFPPIRKRCMEIKRGMPDIFQTIFQCNPGAREGSIFLEKDFRYFSHRVSEMHPQTLPEFLRRALIVQSWDTSQKDTKDSDYSVCLTCAILPCNEYHRGESIDLLGNPDPHYDVYVLDMFRKKVEIGELLRSIRELNQRWNPGVVLIEEKASGIQALQALQNSAIPIQGVKANTSKRARATEGIGGGPWSVQGTMQQGRIIFWAELPQIEIIKTELKNFTGDGAGHDDIVDSLVIATSHAISMATGTPILPDNFETQVIKPTLAEIAVYDPRAIGLNNLSVLLEQGQYSSVPEICATCSHKTTGNFCPIQGRQVSGMDTCGSWKTFGH